ncbi:GyrI-like domain-containing protein [Methylorubrum populi]|uniref:GyrI-like domain-containing protein n=1 Tax=Methylorubrum populi TaxID=223967 RepID=A0A921JFH7_9HYPH|nr:GyrI-like domain-containing protein [Methylorubrum populi]
MIRLAPLAAALLALASTAALAQGAPPPSNAPSPAETNPLPTTTKPDTSKSGPDPAAPAPEQAPIPRPAQSGAAPSVTPPPSALPTLVPSPGEPNDVDPVTLPAKPVAILSGQTKWEAARGNLRASFKTIGETLAKLGLKPAGRPIALFTKTEDDGFQYEAMIPIEAAPAQTTETNGVTFGSSPSGKALRFKHSGTYEEIDGTYETLTAYLDAKEIDVQDRFLEEYVTDLGEGADDKLDINIYALPK